MTRQDVKIMIGDFSEIENEKLLEKIIENYEDDASYKEAYLISPNDSEGNASGNVFAILDYGTSFTLIDEYGNSQNYDEDDVSERYTKIETEIKKICDYFKDCDCEINFTRS